MNRRVKKEHTVRSLSILNEKRFWRRVDAHRILDTQFDCWIWVSTILKHNKMPWFWVQTLEGTQVQTNARRYAWDLTRHPPLKPEDVLTPPMCKEEKCINPWHREIRGQQDYKFKDPDDSGQPPPPGYIKL